MQEQMETDETALLTGKMESLRERGLLPGDLENEEREELEDLLWKVLKAWEGKVFLTAKGLEFTYSIRGNEMFVSRKDKSLTRATVILAFEKAMLLQKDGGEVTGPKKLGTFGASYLYPVFLGTGVIKA